MRKHRTRVRWDRYTEDDDPNIQVINNIWIQYRRCFLPLESFLCCVFQSRRFCTFILLPFILIVTHGFHVREISRTENNKHHKCKELLILENEKTSKKKAVDLFALAGGLLAVGRAESIAHIVCFHICAASQSEKLSPEVHCHLHNFWGFFEPISLGISSICHLLLESQHSHLLQPFFNTLNNLRTKTDTVLILQALSVDFSLVLIKLLFICFINTVLNAFYEGVIAAGVEIPHLPVCFFVRIPILYHVNSLHFFFQKWGIATSVLRRKDQLRTLYS